jgi:transposase-like protein
MTTIDSITPSTPKQRRTPRRWTPQQRAEWVALFEKSGQSVLRFCRDHDLRAATLSLWRAQRRKWGEDGALVEIPVAALSAPSTHTAAVTSWKALMACVASVTIHQRPVDQSDWARRCSMTVKSRGARIRI